MWISSPQHLPEERLIVFAGTMAEAEDSTSGRTGLVELVAEIPKDERASRSAEVSLVLESSGSCCGRIPSGHDIHQSPVSEGQA